MIAQLRASRSAYAMTKGAIREIGSIEGVFALGVSTMDNRTTLRREEDPFGPGTKPGAVLVTIGVAEAGLRRLCGDVTPAGRLVDTLAVPEEQDVPLFVSTEPKTTLQALWPRLDPRCDSCRR